MELKWWLTGLNGRVGGKDAEGPLDWSSVGIISEEHNGSEIAHSGDDMEGEYENGEGSEEENLENSHFNWDIADWDVQCARDRSLTLRMEHSIIPQIVEVTGASLK